MSTHDLYTVPPELRTWSLDMAGQSRFTWEYDDGRDRMLALYQKGKDKQWDSTKRIDWDLEVDPYDVLGVPDETLAIHGTPLWERMDEAQRREVRRHSAAWQFSQFLHGEQGAMICSARIVESVPDLDSKFYAATQTMDEARHAETYARFLQEKVGLAYPINEHLKALLDSTLTDSRWDMPYLGMQVLIEGLALAAFGVMRDFTTKPLPKQILAYVMQDEARHVAFGRMALRDYYRDLSESELREREDFVIEGCYLMRDRLRGRETWEYMGLSKAEVDEAMEATDRSEYLRVFRSLLFSRIVPCVKDIGLWSPRLQQAYADMGVLDMAGQSLEALMKQDEDIAERLDQQRFAEEEAERHAEVAETIVLGDSTS
ncbi:ferritin-like domain-containing protein [Nonomuraea rhodomycinica]|uniref:Ferritin-like domain-containing protein n=1 Tax=Nonomuraea rhodomycinica TaxID=1712872 RepID=A0A7Y6MD61_9ACTN|nr:ferritin-like domain-containing protein [Nonomuraea rhodomycinica]NUW44118.1 ferritin-like domain-containing protein [Nonomuraea rhodomycinica]